MWKHAINQFLGQTTIDPGIERAFNEGHIVDVLYAFNLEPDLIRIISTIRAASFDEFLARAYFSAIGNQPEPGSGHDFCHPLDNLHPQGRDPQRRAA